MKNGDYTAESIEAIGNIGFGIGTYDRQDLAANSNGVYNIRTIINGSRNFEIDFKRFSFDETKHINQLIDYEHFSAKKQRIQKLFRKNNPLSLFKSTLNDGVIKVEDAETNDSFWIDTSNHFLKLKLQEKLLSDKDSFIKSFGEIYFSYIKKNKIL